MIKKDLKRQKQRANKKKKKLAANFDTARFKTALMVMARGSLISSAVLTQLAKNLKPKKGLSEHTDSTQATMKAQVQAKSDYSLVQLLDLNLFKTTLCELKH